MASVRYLVEDADAAAAFYVDVLGFELEQRMGPVFTIVTRGRPHPLAQRPGHVGRAADAGR